MPTGASDFRPYKELIQDGENGFLFETENAAGLTIKLQTMLDKETSLESVSQAEKEFIEWDFSLNKIGKQHLELYQAILEEKV